MTTTPLEETTGVASRHVLAVVLLGMFTTSFPFTVLSASLDTISEDLGSSLSTIAWIQVAPALAAGVALPALGKCCDLWGARLVWLTALGLTAVFSVLTACAWSAPSLIAIRTIGQVAGAAAGPAGFAIVGHTFSGPERARAIGRLGSVSAIAPIVGVAVGGPLVDWIGWQVLFLLQAVPATIGFLFGLKVLPEAGPRREATFDIAGAVLLGATVVAALFGLNRIRVLGFWHPVVLVCFAVTPLLGWAFLAVERRVEHPLAPLHYLRRTDFRLALTTLWLMQATFLGGSIAIPLVLHRRYGYDLTVVAYIAAARPVGFATGSWISPGLARRFGADRVQVFAAVVMTTAGAVLVGAALHRLVPVLVLGFVMGGFGSGMGYTTVLTTINNLSERADIGVTNGIASMMGSIGGATGVTIVSAVIADSADGGPFVTGFLVLATFSAATLLTTGASYRLHRHGPAPAPAPV